MNIRSRITLERIWIKSGHIFWASALAHHECLPFIVLTLLTWVNLSWHKRQHKRHVNGKHRILRKCNSSAWPLVSIVISLSGIFNVALCQTKQRDPPLSAVTGIVTRHIKTTSVVDHQFSDRSPFREPYRDYGDRNRSSPQILCRIFLCRAWRAKFCETFRGVSASVLSLHLVA